jgi:hypothetical protein
MVGKPIITLFAVRLPAVTLSAVLGLLAGAVPALASDHSGQEHTYGGPAQTWCDVDPGCNGWNNGLHHASYESSAPGLTLPDRKHRPSHKRETTSR